MDVLRPQSRSSLLESLVESAPDALLVVDAAGRIVLANRTAETLFGFGGDELINTKLEQLIPERLRAVHVKHRLAYAHNPRTREMGAAVADLVAIRRDGAEFPVEIRLSPIDVAGERLFAAAVRDVTDRRHTAEALRVAQDEANRANAAKGRFLATASHDLRQPVQTLRLLNASLQRQISDPQAQHILAREREALDAMARLLNALLDISKLDSGSIKPDIEDLNVAELLRALQEEYEPTATARGLKLTVETTPHCIRTDRTLFRQLLENLLTNALKYTDAGAVSLCCAADDAGLAITVADTGVGIAPDQIEAIFDEFYQVDRRSGRHGVGLGLAIVRRLVALLGLSLDVQSQVQQGSRFRVRIPPGLVVHDVGVQLRPAASASSARLNGVATILLVEDDDAVRSATELYLKAIGHVTLAARALAEVDELMQAAAHAPDLIITDYHLGMGETGLDVIEHVRLRTKRVLPALLLSGDTSAAMRHLMDVPSCRILSKPVDVDELTDVLTELLSSPARV